MDRKIAFVELNAFSNGGVRGVNDTLSKNLPDGFCSKRFFLRSHSLTETYENGFIARKGSWHLTEWVEIKKALSRFRLFSAVKLTFQRIADTLKYKKDVKVLKKAIAEYAPEKIVVSHYLLLRAVPENMLCNTFMHAHTSFEETANEKAGYRTLLSYNGRINFIFLSDRILEKAKEAGFQNAHRLYNPIKFKPGEIGEKEKKIAVITRFSPEKRLPEMIASVAKVLSSFPEWSFDIYGIGPEEEKIKKAVPENARISVLPRTEHPEKVLENASLTLNTSLFEGFSLSIIEAAAMGVPAVSFVFGEAAEEEIADGKTGLLIPQNDWNLFEKTLSELLSDKEKLKVLSENAREFSKSFTSEKIVSEFIDILYGGQNGF